MYNKQELINNFKKAICSGSFLTPKHDPNGVIVYNEFRTVLSLQASSSLENLINSEQYSLYEYFNKKHQKNSYKLIPYDTSSYTTKGLGIQSGSLATSGSFDTFLIVSGSFDGWHIYAENSNKIISQIESGIILDNGEII